MIGWVARRALQAAGAAALAAIVVIRAAETADRNLADTDVPQPVGLPAGQHTADLLRRLAREAEHTPGQPTPASVAEWLRWHADIQTQTPIDTPLARNRREARILRGA